MNNKGYWLSYILFFGGLLGWKCIFVFHQWQRWNWGKQGAITSRKNYFFNIVSLAFSYFVIFLPFSCEIWLVASPTILFRSIPLHHSLSSSHLIIIITTTTIILYNNNDTILSSLQSTLPLLPLHRRYFLSPSSSLTLTFNSMSRV